MQIRNDAIADGRVSSPEKAILNNFRDLVKDIPEILDTLAEADEIDPNSDIQEEKIKVVDEAFQFMLSHLLDEAKKSGEVKKEQFDLLEVISQKLETCLDVYIKTGYF